MVDYHSCSHGGKKYTIEIETDNQDLFFRILTILTDEKIKEFEAEEDADNIEGVTA